MATKFEIGDYVWIPPVSNDEFAIPEGGKIISMDKGRIRVQDDNGKEIFVSKEQVLKIMHSTSIKWVEDMINLGDLQEYSILRNLEFRYNDGFIYTYTGTMLVATNPYEVLPIYTNALIKEYRNKKIGELPPHIFAVGDSCYNDMQTKHENQCIVISGESGAGKTESTKLILQYLATISGKHSWIEQQILESNPIMEAFGNAKTVRNDNSSRFGKYIDVSFNKSGNIEGAKIEQYLLEKSRIVVLNEHERNYHIFYSMVAGLSKDEKKRLHLGQASDFNYLKGGKTLSCEGRNEASEFANIRAAMKVLNFTNRECSDIFQMLAVILHLGNLKFNDVSISNLDTSDISDMALVIKIASFLGTDKETVKTTLTRKSILARGDKVISHLNKEQASEVRDAFSKALYGRMFVWIIDKINDVIKVTRTFPKLSSIGVLDIFGFENFKINSFEQLCINYANENLQQFFVKQIFKMEQQYYTNEAIKWTHISFVDNRDVLDMIGVKSLNIMSLIDEESKFPKGTDTTMLSKLHSTHGDKKMYYKKPKSDLVPAFGIQHFAGEVVYEVPGFLEKNRDAFSQDLKELIKTCKNDYLKKLFKQDLYQDSSRTITLSSQFRSSLDALMKNLNSRHPYFIRCIKPNEMKQAKSFDKSLCCRQLRYSGMMETAKIRKAGYAIRYTYLEFVQRYRHLRQNVQSDYKTNCKKACKTICDSIFINGEDYQFGKTKIFLKEEQNTRLEEERNIIMEKSSIILQKFIRAWMDRRKFLKLREAALTIQKHFRARGYRSNYLTVQSGYQRLVAKIRSRQLAFDFRKSKKIVTKFQAFCKGYLIRHNHQFGKIVNVVKIKTLEQKKLRDSGDKNYRRVSEHNMQRRLMEMEIPEEDAKSASEFVDNEFHFLLHSATTTVKKKNKGLLSMLKDGDPYKKTNLDLLDYNFIKFASTYFVANANPQFSRNILEKSLLYLPTPEDVMAANALWITILRFMGDMHEPKLEPIKSNKENVMNLLINTLNRKSSNRKELQELPKEGKFQKNLDKSSTPQFISTSLKGKNKFLGEVRNGSIENNFASDNYTKWINCKSNNLEKVHFIIGHGILRPELRDEVFCQICKQLTNNPSKTSHARGWILLSLTVGCFAPSEKFINCLRSFIRDGPPGYAPYCEERLHRTFTNGARTQPPSWLELQATKNKELVRLQVTFMDKRRKIIQVDSASTSEEVCRQIATTLNLKDNFGFSLFITLFDKVMSLGSSSEHVMDAISKCEQTSKENWSLFYRKDIFAPWHDVTEDSVATDLIYHQIVRGLKFGEYRCNAEGDLAALVAQQYYIDNGPHIDTNILHSQIEEYLPNYVDNRAHTLEEWEKKIIEAFNRSACVKQKYPVLKVKEDIVRYARMVWPILFSRFFQVDKISGSSLSKSNVIIAVNWTGVYVIDEREQILLEVPFVEISYVGFEQENRTLTQKLILSTVQEEYVFRCAEAENLNKLIVYLLDGLKKRSRYCVAVQNYKHPEDSPSFLTLKKGDLIILKSNEGGKLLLSSTWGHGECNRRFGDFPTEVVQILPTLHKPTPKTLALFAKKEEQSVTEEAVSTKLYTLARYAEEHFKVDSAGSKEELWKYTNRPLLGPLLKKLQNNEEATKLSCKAFLAILKYAGDLPCDKPKIVTEHTDDIFSAPLSDDLLKDEIYCQIMKQLTLNRLSHSQEKMWELMFLITGLFIPSSSLMVELNKFLKSRTHSFVELCLKRLQKTQKFGSRKYPPTSIEIEAIQHHNVEIYHKIYFPNDTHEVFEIDSTAKASDLSSVISAKLGLISKEGFSVFVTIFDKTFSIPHDSFFYDFLYELFGWAKQLQTTWNSVAPVQAQYQIHFIRKLWLNVSPSYDFQADQIFHYYQELSRYLHGYHNIAKEEVVTLASLVYRAKYGSNIKILSTGILKELLPQTLMHTQSTQEWQKQIALDYNKDVKLSVEEAKTKFLKIISNCSTFGSNFFQVKQTSDSSYPEIVVIAINESGVKIIDPQTKVFLVQSASQLLATMAIRQDILATYGFLELNNWSSGNTFFYLIVGNMMGAKKLLCETLEGYIMDDLITSYTDYIKKKEII